MTLHAHIEVGMPHSKHSPTPKTRQPCGTGASNPHKRKWYRPTMKKSTGIRMQGAAPERNGQRDDLIPVAFTAHPAISLTKQRLSRCVWSIDLIGKHLHLASGGRGWCTTVCCHVGQTLAADLGEIHPAAIANEAGSRSLRLATYGRSRNTDIQPQPNVRQKLSR